MKTLTEFQLMIPHLLVLEDEEFLKNIDPQDFQTILQDAAEETYQEDPQTHGMYQLQDLENPDEGAIPVCWHINIYNALPELKSGIEQPNDFEQIKRKLIDYLMLTSLNLSIEDNDENLALYDSGVFKVKLGSGESKRLYEVNYEIIDSNSEEAMADAFEMLDEMEKQEDSETFDLSPKRVLH